MWKGGGLQVQKMGMVGGGGHGGRLGAYEHGHT